MEGAVGTPKDGRGKIIRIKEKVRVASKTELDLARELLSKATLHVVMLRAESRFNKILASLSVGY